MSAAASATVAGGRRRFLGTLASLPLLGGFGASFFARKADAAAAAVSRQILEAEQRCHDAKKTLDDAGAAFEAAIPELPSFLDLTKRRRFLTTTIERRFFDHKPVKRGAIQFGLQQHRYVATIATLNRDIDDATADRPHAVKILKTMRRHAARYEMAVRQAETSHRLSELQEEHEAAQRALIKLGEAIFDEPATTAAAVQAQARTLTAYVTATRCPERSEPPLAGRWGDRLATGVLLAGSRLG